MCCARFIQIMTFDITERIPFKFIFLNDGDTSHLTVVNSHHQAPWLSPCCFLLVIVFMSLDTFIYLHSEDARLSAFS